MLNGEIFEAFATSGSVEEVAAGGRLGLGGGELFVGTGLLLPDAFDQRAAGTFGAGLS